MGIYYSIILFGDITLEGSYGNDELSWRTSVICKFAGILVMTSLQVSSLLITWFLIQLMFLILYPVICNADKFRSLTIQLISLFWIYGITASFIPISSQTYFGKYFFGNYGLCLPLYLTPSPPFKGWEYSFILITVLGSCWLCITIFCFMFSKCKMNEAIEGQLGSNAYIIAAMKLSSSFVTFNTMCWLPLLFLSK